jgi:hypothetical protein
MLQQAEDSFLRLLGIWTHTRNGPKRRLFWLGLVGFKNFYTKQFPNHTSSNPPPLVIPVDDDGIVKDVHRTINDHPPTYDLLIPHYDILQAIRAILHDLRIHTDIAHVKVAPSCGMNLTLVHQKSMCSLTNKLIPSTGLFPSWIPGTRAALFHGEQQVTKGIPVYIRDAAHTLAMKEHLIRDKSWDDGHRGYKSTIDWHHYGKSLKKLPTNGCRIQKKAAMIDQKWTTTPKQQCPPI